MVSRISQKNLLVALAMAVAVAVAVAVVMVVLAATVRAVAHRCRIVGVKAAEQRRLVQRVHLKMEAFSNEFCNLTR